MVLKRTRELRLAMAKDMLLYTNLRPIEIARRLGFTCEGDFRALFKRHVHTTPIQWRNGHHQYNPEWEHHEQSVRKIKIACDLKYHDGVFPEYRGSIYLAPTHLSPIESIQSLSLDTVRIVGTDGAAARLIPSEHVYGRPAMHRIDTSAFGRLNGVRYDVQIAASTRNYTVDVAVPAHRAWASVDMEVMFNTTAPILPEGATLWSAPNIAK